MAIYGATTVVRALLSEHTNNEDRFLINNTGNNGDRVNRIRLRPKAWTNACAWKPAGTCFGADDWDNETCTAFAPFDADRMNAMESLRLVRSGAINQGVFTSGSLTADGRARVDAFVDRWHCRRLARRYENVLAAVLKQLARRVRMRVVSAYLHRWRAVPPPRRLLRPRLSLILNIRRRHLLHKMFASWALIVRQREVDRGAVRRRGTRILRLLRRREVQLKAIGLARWREGVKAMRQLEHRKTACFEKWKLFLLLSRHNSTSGIERAMGILRRVWLRRLIFDGLVAWQTTRAAARRLQDVLASALLRRAWVSWGVVVRLCREQVVRSAWNALALNLENARQRQLLAVAHSQRRVLQGRLRFLREASNRRRRWRQAFNRWARNAVCAKNERRSRMAALCRLSAAHASKLQRRAFDRWKSLEAERPTVVPEVAALRPKQAAGSPRPTVCRCVRCVRRYGYLGGHANRPRSACARRVKHVVTESRCNASEHLELRVRLARRTLNKGLSRSSSGVNG